MINELIESLQKRFHYYENVGIRAIEQIKDESKLFWQYNEQSNSIAITVNHLHGNMLSRFTNFYTEDGEKPWRKRDAEFENNIHSKKELLEKWHEGWNTVFDVIDNLTPEKLNGTVTIRNEQHSVIDAINRQLTHYAYHIGEIVYTAKMICGNDWQSLTIPKGKSEEFNRKMMQKKK
ncbi:MAG TPA: hypothetical protein DIU39_00130 [Flavobacteriales bacterium]|nr:hypothetical protein [Flavobacteriales bacterium]